MCDVPALRAHVGGSWQLWNIANGALRPLTDHWPDVQHPESQIWARRDAWSPWVFDLPLTPDRDGLWTNKRLPDHVTRVEDGDDPALAGCWGPRPGRGGRLLGDRLVRRGRSRFGLAARGDELWALDLPLAAPQAPSALTAVSASGNEVSLSWADNSGNEAAFLLERSAAADFTTVAKSVKLPAGVTRYVDSGLAPASTYFYRVRAANRAGESANATASAATPANPASRPATPTTSRSRWAVFRSSTRR